jgi:hypothetical protein
MNGLALMPKEPLTSAGGTVRIAREFHRTRLVLAGQQRSLCTSGSDVRQRIAAAIGVAEDVLDLEVHDDPRNFGEAILLRDIPSGATIRLQIIRLTE